MKYISILLFVFLSNIAFIFSQGAYPPNPKPGMCYIRCAVEKKVKKSDIQIVQTPAFKKYEIIAAKYETVVEKVMVKEESKKFELIPAVFKTVKDSIIITESYNKITLSPVKFANAVETVVIQPAYSDFEYRSSVGSCKSKNPRDCEVLCYVQYPEQTTHIPVRKMEVDASYSSKSITPKYKVYEKQVLVSPAHVKEIIIPAVYKSVNKQKLVSDETARETSVEPQIFNQEINTFEEESSSRSEGVWEEIECSLIDYNVLPIYYSLNSASLNTESKEIINKKLYKLMLEKPGIRIEISSHTDSRDSDKYNMDLSQRRAQSVVNYLVAKGIKKNRMSAIGFGETRLKEPCPNGSNCTEAQHAKNRRTEFRVLQN
ncbi:MAG: OmpA family protein [Saprospiraceae bacterium]